MSKNFNLLLLHDSEIDRHPRTWVCISGKGIRQLVKKLELKAIQRKRSNREGISKTIGKKLDCHFCVIKRLLQGRNAFYPLPAIMELAELAEDKKTLKKIMKEAKCLKVNSASAKPIRAVKRLDKTLARIIGAFMADGSLSVQVVFETKDGEELKIIKKELEEQGIPCSSGYAASRKRFWISVITNKTNLTPLRRFLKKSSQRFFQTHYNIELTEEYQSSVEAFNSWIEECFEIKPTSFKRRGNAWRTIFSNKILARYLTGFFGVTPGPKTVDAFEPNVIKESDLEVRKAFAQGAITFDGCATVSRKVMFSTKSKKFFGSIKEIWKKDGIKFGFSINSNREEINIFSYADNKPEKLLAYFAPNTQKWNLLKWMHGSITESPEKTIKPKTSASLDGILDAIKEKKTCDIGYLTNKFGRRYVTIMHYLDILVARKKIVLSCTPTGINREGVDERTTVLLSNPFHQQLFGKVRENYVEDQRLATVMGVKKGTFSAWKLRKNRIPIKFLAKICLLVGIPLREALKNVCETDRKIAFIA